MSSDTLWLPRLMILTEDDIIFAKEGTDLVLDQLALNHVTFIGKVVCATARALPMPTTDFASIRGPCMSSHLTPHLRQVDRAQDALGSSFTGNSARKGSISAHGSSQPVPTLALFRASPASVPTAAPLPASPPCDDRTSRPPGAASPPPAAAAAAPCRAARQRP
jgi:hypothetical protein